jgi:syntaxin 5
MVAEQRETVQRIDADTHDIAANVEGGQRELLKVLARVSNSRWLMLKIFGVLIVFVSLSYNLSSILTISARSSWFLFSFRDERPRWD